MTNEELVSLIQSGVDAQNNMGLLWEQNRNFIIQIARPFSQSCELEDLIQEAYFGLEGAVQKFDAERGFRFLTYAEDWVRSAIQRYCQNNGRLKRVPVSVLKQISKYMKFQSDYRAVTGLEPVDEEYCIFLKISPVKLDKLWEYMMENNTVSFDSPIPGTEDRVIGDTIPDGFDLEGTLVDQITGEQAARDLWAAVDNLNGNRAAVVKRYFRDNEPMETIGTELQISTERVRQLKAQALRTLRSDRRVKKAAEIYGYGCSQAYHWGVGRFKATGTSSTEFLALKHIEQNEQRKRITADAMYSSTETDLIAGRMKEKYGYIPPGIQRLQEVNAEIDRMIQEYREKRWNESR